VKVETRTQGSACFASPVKLNGQLDPENCNQLSAVFGIETVNVANSKKKHWLPPV
jgi:hypothetical protein